MNTNLFFVFIIFLFFKSFAASFSEEGDIFNVNATVTSSGNTYVAGGLGIYKDVFVVVWQDAVTPYQNVLLRLFSTKDGGTPKAINDPIIINDQPTESIQENQPRVAILNNDKFIVTWREYSTGNGDIYIQIYQYDPSKPDKIIKLGDNKLIASTTNLEATPIVAPLSTDKFIISWRKRITGNEWRIWAALYDISIPESPSLIGDHFRVSNITDPNLGSGQSHAPQIVSGLNDNENNFIIIWQTDFLTPTYPEAYAYIYGKIYDGSSYTTTPEFKKEFLIESNSIVGIIKNQVAADKLDKHKFIVCWAETDEIYSKLYKIDELYNLEDSGRFLVSQSQSLEIDDVEIVASVGYKNDFFITWTDLRNDDMGIPNYDIYGRIFSTIDEDIPKPIGDEFWINRDSSFVGEQQQRASINSFNQHLIVIWENRDSLNIEGKLYNYTSLTPPYDFNGEVVFNRGFFEEEKFVFLKWNNNILNEELNVKSYYLYDNGDKINEFSPSGPFSIIYRNIKKGKHMYWMTTINSENKQSAATDPVFINF